MFYVNFTDYMRKEENDFSIYRPFGTDDFVFIYFPEEMIFELKGEKVISKKNSVILFSPGTYQKFKARDSFINSYVHFTADEDFLKEFKIPTETLLYPSGYETINSLIKQLQREHVYQKAHSRQMCDSIIRQLLIFLARDINEGDGKTLKEKFDKLRLNMIINCTKNLSPEELAEALHMSKSRFYEYYADFYGASPKQELLRARMELSKILLTNRDKTVKEIAYEVGFENVEHFTRYYKKTFGTSPRQSNK